MIAHPTQATDITGCLADGLKRTVSRPDLLAVSNTSAMLAPPRCEAIQSSIGRPRASGECREDAGFR